MANRRLFIIGAAAAASAGVLAACARDASSTTDSASPGASESPSASASPDLDHFVVLSTLLTGYATLDDGTAAAYLQNLRADAQQSAALDDLFTRSGVASSSPPASLDALTARGAFATPALLAVTSRILAAWYSGTLDAASGAVTQTWDGALAWKACTFTKPPATCGGATGYWAKPPA